MTLTPRLAPSKKSTRAKEPSDDGLAYARSRAAAVRARPRDDYGFDPDSARAVVEAAKAKGLIRTAEDRAKIEKNGHDAFEQRLGVRTQWIVVTPEKAQDWLRNNFRNRPVSEDTVRAYARDMQNGLWVPTHQGIAFNDKDELIDGQHRLLAIVQSGVSVELMVTFGLRSGIAGKEMTTMDAVDRGRPRSVADQLKIQHGMKDGSAIAMICASVASLCCGERTRRLSVGQTLDVFRAYEWAVTWTIEHRAKSHGLRTAGVLAGFVFAMACEGALGGPKKGEVSRMFELMNSGEGLGPSGVGRLREFLLSDESKLFTPTLNRGLAELTLQAIYLDRMNRPCVKLEMDLAGAEHFRTLQRERVEKIAGIFKLPR